MFIEDPEEFMIEQIRRYKDPISKLGKTLVALGIATLCVALIFSAALNFCLGLITLGAATAIAIHLVKTRELPNSSSKYVAFVLYLTLGCVLLFYPIQGVVTLNLLIPCFFILDGFFTLTSSMQLRPVPGWMGFLTGGFLSFILALLIVIQWSQGHSAIVAALFGLGLISSGLQELNLIRKLPKQ
jgi:uncharacterized membrane protein HdeD (DUF308 family)